MKILTQSHTDLKETFTLRNLFHTFQEAAPTYCTILSDTPKIFNGSSRSKDQYIKQSFCTVIAIPDDEAIRPETCRS